MKVLLPFLLLLFVAGCSSPQQEETVKVDKNYDPILTPYFNIVKALQQDEFDKARGFGKQLATASSDTGVKLALTRMGTLMSQSASTYDQRTILEQMGMVITLYIEQEMLNNYFIYKFKCNNEFGSKEVVWYGLSKNTTNPFIGENSNDCIELVETIEPVLKKDEN